MQLDDERRNAVDNGTAKPHNVAWLHTLSRSRGASRTSWCFSSSHTRLTNRESRQAHINTHQKERKQQTNARCKLPRRLLQQIREEVQDLPCKQDCALDSINVGYETVFVFPLPNTVWQVRFCDCWILPRRICEEKQNKTNKKTKKKKNLHLIAREKAAWILVRDSPPLTPRAISE